MSEKFLGERKPELGAPVTLQLAPDELVSSQSPNPDLMYRLHEYLRQPGAPNERLYPRWLANRLDVDERELLGTLAHALRNGLVELHWEVYCPYCTLSPIEFDSLRQVRSRIDCVACEADFDIHLDRDVRVTFSASKVIQSARGSEIVTMPQDSDQIPTRGLDLLLIPAFWELFSGEAPAADESLSIARVALLFTDLRGSTAIYAERGDPRAYRLVRDHFGILGEAINRNNGALVKTIGDAVMASFGSGADAVLAAFESQAELTARAGDVGGELVLKAGVHAGACLAVKLNDRLDFFGSAVNTAARVQGLSHGNDVVVSDAVIADIDAEEHKLNFQIGESFDAPLRGLPEPVHVHRLVSVKAR